MLKIKRCKAKLQQPSINPLMQHQPNIDTIKLNSISLHAFLPSHVKWGICYPFIDYTTLISRIQCVKWGIRAISLSISEKNSSGGFKSIAKIYSRILTRESWESNTFFFFFLFFFKLEYWWPVLLFIRKFGRHVVVRTCNGSELHETSSSRRTSRATSTFCTELPRYGSSRSEILFNNHICYTECFLNSAPITQLCLRVLIRMNGGFNTTENSFWVVLKPLMLQHNEFEFTGKS